MASVYSVFAFSLSILSKSHRLAFYYPMVGLINLFVSVLKSPTLPSAQSDVALLDVAAGHFGQMEFVTSAELAFPFTREVAALARMTVKRAKERSSSIISPSPSDLGRQFNVEMDSLNKVIFAAPFAFHSQ